MMIDKSYETRSQSLDHFGLKNRAGREWTRLGNTAERKQRLQHCGTKNVSSGFTERFAPEQPNAIRCYLLVNM